jgi:FKBP-type peptidyl-prolyl cis-trans isomerase
MKVVPLLIAATVLIGALTAGAAHGQKSKAKPGPSAPKSGQTKEKWVKTKTGLQYLDLVVGKGKSPKMGDKVKVRYTGWLMNGKEFDSSGDTPTEFKLSEVVEGWQEGLQTMKVGGKRKLVVPSNLGYGAGGYPPRIPPNATLIFVMELVSITSKKK